METIDHVIFLFSILHSCVILESVRRPLTIQGARSILIIWNPSLERSFRRQRTSEKVMKLLTQLLVIII